MPSLWTDQLYYTILTTLKMERDFQAPSFESNRSFLALFVMEILKNKIKNCKFGFRSNIRIHLLSSLIVKKKKFMFVCA